MIPKLYIAKLLSTPCIIYDDGREFLDGEMYRNYLEAWEPMVISPIALAKYFDYVGAL